MNLCYLIGGVALIALKVIKWHTPVAVLAALFTISMIFNLVDSDIHASPLLHVFAGGTLLCAFYVATDPVSSASTNSGRLIQGLLIAIIAFSIRTWGGFPDGFAFAVLIVNALVPLIDRFTRPKILGEQGA